jgi:CRISPR/Cas system-associated protein Csx1
VNEQHVNWRTATYSNGSGQCVEVGQWRTASYSNGSGQCVEVGSEASTVVVRDTKNREGMILTVPADAWRCFIGSLK